MRGDEDPRERGKRNKEEEKKKYIGGIRRMRSLMSVLKYLLAAAASSFLSFCSLQRRHDALEYYISFFLSRSPPAERAKEEIERERERPIV